MGLDLQLLPFDGEGQGINFSHTILDTDRHCGFYERVKELPQMDVPDDFRSFVSHDDQRKGSHYWNAC